MTRAEKLIRLSGIFFNYKRGNTVIPYPPLRVWIESTNQCNLKCAVCPNSTDEISPRGIMDVSLYEAIISQLKDKANDLNLSHRGEPLFHPHLDDMIRIARRNGLGTRIHTNATLMDQAQAEKLMADPPDLLSFSFDGFDKQTYESVRIGSNFETTLQNITYFLKLKNRLKQKMPYTVIQIIEPWQTDDHYRMQLDVFGKRLLELGLDKFYVKRPHNWGGNTQGELNGKTGFIPCTFLFYSLTILWDGTVCPCPQDWYGSLALGNLKQQKVDEIWNGEVLTDLRRRMFRQDLQGLLCQTCDRVFRPVTFGIPTENLRAFLGETMAGYKWVRKLIRT